MWWEHLLDWVQDEKVWDWIRTAAAALIGAVVGGWFALWGQSRAAKTQAERDAVARGHQLVDAQRAQGVADARALHAGLIELNRLVRDSPHQRTTAPFPQPESLNPEMSWIRTWREIWTDVRRLTLRQQAELLPDAPARESALEVLSLLDIAPSISNESKWPGGRRSLYGLASALSDEGIRVVSAYLRGDSYATRRHEFMSYLRVSTDEYGEWLIEQESAESTPSRR